MTRDATQWEQQSCVGDDSMGVGLRENKMGGDRMNDMPCLCSAYVAERFRCDWCRKSGTLFLSLVPVIIRGGGVNFTSSAEDQTFNIHLTGCCLAVWEIRYRVSKIKYSSKIERPSTYIGRP